MAPEGYAFRGLAKVMESRFEEAGARAMARRLDEYDRAGYELVKTDRVRAPKTVLVDMTADWCLTCKTLEATALDTAAVRELIRANGVVPLKADYTHMDPEVSRLLKAVNAGGVPVIAIYPAGKPKEPIVFRDGYRTDSIVKALREAGPSQL
jgi:thiol:disulfide interchange protein